jgi:hypothetical protein
MITDVPEQIGFVRAAFDETRSAPAIQDLVQPA